MATSKGSNFEREICKKLSLWWSDEKRDDIFWRTSGSGARATYRRKKGKDTYGQEGDIQAIDPIGSPLTQLVTIECKRGYSSINLTDLLDKSNKKTKPCLIEQFITQAINENIYSKTYYWWLIVRRNNRQAILLMPYKLYKLFQTIVSLPKIYFIVNTPICDNKIKIAIVRLDDFLKIVNRDIIEIVLNKCKT